MDAFRAKVARWLIRLAAIAGFFFAQTAAAQSIAPPPDTAPPRITVSAEPGLERLRDEVKDRAPEVLMGIYADLPGLPMPEIVDIRLVKRSSDLGTAAPPGRGAPAWASGVAYPDAGVVVVATRHGAEPIDVHNVVAHELAHLAISAALDYRVPRWLNEGFAYLHSSEWSMARTETLTGMVWFDNVIPLHELDRHFPAHEDEVHRAYAQSYDFVAFLARRGRYIDRHDDGDRWAFRQFLAEIAAGKSVGEAAEAAYTTTLGKLFIEWESDLRERYLLAPVGMVALSFWLLAAVLLVLAYLRKRRQSRAMLRRWDEEEERLAAAAAALTAAPSPLHIIRPSTEYLH